MGIITLACQCDSTIESALFIFPSSFGLFLCAGRPLDAFSLVPRLIELSLSEVKRFHYRLLVSGNTFCRMFCLLKKHFLHMFATCFPVSPPCGALGGVTPSCSSVEAAPAAPSLFAQLSFFIYSELRRPGAPRSQQLLHYERTGAATRRSLTARHRCNHDGRLAFSPPLSAGVECARATVQMIDNDLVKM